MRRFLALCLFSLCAVVSSFAQTTGKLTDAASAKIVLPEFKTDSSLIMPLNRSEQLFHGSVTFNYPVTVVTAPNLCFTMHSYNFSRGETPKKIGESTCTDAKLVRLLPVVQDKKSQDESDAPKK